MPAPATHVAGSPIGRRVQHLEGHQVIRNRSRPGAVGLLGIWFFSCAVCQVAHCQDRPADNPTAAQIADALDKVRSGKLLDAVEKLQRVLDTSGEELVPVNDRHLVPARWVVHGHLARLPVEGVNLYRQRVDGQAAKRLDEAKKQRDDSGLERLLADMFAASPCEEAILELARRAFERGVFDAAEHYWRMLLPPYEGDNRLLRFPRPKTDVAAVKARLLLVKLFRGERDEAKNELNEFREQYANASGLLAGKTGKYVDTLAELFKDPATTTLPRLPDRPDWPTFAGSPARTGTLRCRPPYFWPDVPTWRTSLPFARDRRPRVPPVDASHPRSLSFYPVVSNGRAYIADGARIISINLMTGQVARVGEPRDGADTTIPTKQDVRFTLTEHEGILYARFGPAALTTRDQADTFIVAYGARKGDSEERNALWRLNPPNGEEVTHFEGAPVVSNDHLYVGLWRQVAGDAVAGVACYRINDPKTTPELVWQRIVGKAGSEPNSAPRYRHELVTISGPNLIYCTDGGSVIALNAMTGKPAWEYRYPRDERPTMPRYRDLCPPLADGGRIYAAPADTNRLLCLDAYTGRLIWEREGVEVVHLLGVARGRLIATFAGQVKGIRGLNLRTGADSGENGWTIHDDGGESTFGRGLVSEEAVVWPTKHGLHFLDPRDGTPLRSPIPGPTTRLPDGTPLPAQYPGPFGNLCYADGVLLVTTPTEVWGFVSEAKKLSDRRKAVEQEPGNPARHADLTQSLIDAELYTEGEKEAAQSGKSKERLLWLLAEKIIRDADKSEAQRLYTALAKGDGSFAAAGAVRLAEMSEHRAQAREVWKAVWDKNGTVRDRTGVPSSAKAYAERHSPAPLIMRGGLLDGGPPKPAVISMSSGPLTRHNYVALDDPSLRIIATDDNGLVAMGGRLYSSSIGRSYSIDFAPIVAGGIESHFLLADSSRIALLSTDDGKSERVMEIDSSGPILAELSATFPAASGIDGPATTDAIRCSKDSVSFIYDGRSMVTIRPLVADTAVLSVPPGTSARFQPEFLDKSGYQLAKLTSGRMLVSQRHSNECRQVISTAKPWPEPPLTIQNGKFLIPDDGSVFLFDARAGKEIARYTIPNEESLTGELPRFRVHQGDPLLIIDRNYGVEVDRLRMDGLNRAWRREPILAGRVFDDVAFSGEQFFLAADDTLTAYRWNDGERLWETPLPELPHAKWKLAVSPQGLLVHPTEAIMLKPDYDVVGEFRRAGWNFSRLLRRRQVV